MGLARSPFASVWVFSRYSSFLPHCKDMLVNWRFLIGCRSECVCEFLSVCKSAV